MLGAQACESGSVVSADLHKLQLRLTVGQPEFRNDDVAVRLYQIEHLRILNRVRVNGLLVALQVPVQALVVGPPLCLNESLDVFVCHRKPLLKRPKYRGEQEVLRTRRESWA